LGIELEDALFLAEYEQCWGCILGKFGDSDVYVPG